jgi:hypothetical protein
MLIESVRVAEEGGPGRDSWLLNDRNVDNPLLAAWVLGESRRAQG